MAVLQGKKIILGITGSIAAYKTPLLVRLLVREGAEVQVIMTNNAKQFVTPLSLSTVSLNPVLDSVQEGGQWHNHVLIGRSGDLFLVAPCSANTLAQMAQGHCDNMLLAVYLSASCPVMIAPAMDEDMWLHPATQANVARLRSFGNQFIPVGVGALASGLSGAGRMAEPEEILEQVILQLSKAKTQVEELPKKALITAGPTYEALDPVRFLGNYSTGKMGTAIAIALAEKGYQVDLVAGPGVSAPTHKRIQTHAVVSAQQMYEKCVHLFKEAEITVMAAAVADYRPEHTADSKIKKESSKDTLTLRLVQNPDILAHLGKIKRADQLLVGFALETDHEIENAQKKLKAKNADFIVLNSLKDAGAGFGTETNKVTILNAKGDKYPLPLQSKQETAEAIVSIILS